MVEKENKVSVLFSGGKDSSLAAFILSKFFEVELITINFNILENWKIAQKTAKILKFPFKVVYLNKKIIEDAAEMVIKDKRPANGINFIHKMILEETANTSKMIADGIRRNDRVPNLSLSEIISLEDRYNIHYMQPLLGFSRKTINILLEKYFTFKEYKSISSDGAEYEFELREIIRRKYGEDKIGEIFPKNHTHSIITGFNLY